MGKLLIINASPRFKGNCSELCEQALKGAQSSGNQAEIIHLARLNIKPCVGCDTCLINNPHQCVIKDDMQDILRLVTEADAIILASPVYFFTFNAQSKLFIDRLYPLQQGELKGKKFALFMTYGDTDSFSSGAVNALHTFQDICRFFDAQLYDMIYASAQKAGEISLNHEVIDKAFNLGKNICR